MFYLSSSELLIKGVAFHHAGLDNTDRETIENLFRTGAIQVLCCTSTLAVGVSLHSSSLTVQVNLPAHLVIIKNTQVYLENGLTDISDTDLLQMVGRAGRLQYDDAGVAVILTRADKCARYENLVRGKVPLESRLHLQLFEHMNAEIGLCNIFDVESAINWLHNTFFHVRCRVNPTYYGLASDCRGVEELINDLCSQTLGHLIKCGLVVFEDGMFKATPFGEGAAKYYVRRQTIQEFCDIAERATLKSLVRLPGVAVNLVAGNAV